MPGPYSSYITAIQGIYNEALTPALFPLGVRPPLALDEITTTAADGGRQSPPYVLMFDLGSEPKWSFKAHPQVGSNQGNNAMVRCEFRLEVYDFDLGDCDKIMDVILWNGQPPSAHAGIAFASLQLTLPQKGVSKFVIPGRSQRQFSGLERDNKRVHVVRQMFQVQTAISGDGH